MEPSLYERHLAALDSQRGQALAAMLHDAALPRVCAASDAFEAQLEPTWCGLASILTGLRTLAALEPMLHAVPHTQESLFEHERALGHPVSARQLRGGLSLAEGERLLSALLQDLGWQHAVSLRRQSADDVELFAALLWSDLDAMACSASTVLLVNVLRQVQGVWTGHWMVCAAAVLEPDGAQALALDPAAHKLGPHWLPHSVLLSSMCTSNALGQPRGYLVLELAKGAPTQPAKRVDSW